MKLKDFLAKLKADGKITTQEFIDLIETAPDFEFPDKAIEAFENSFLTVDRAVTHKDVHGKLKFEHLNPIDRDLSAIFDVDLKDYIDPLKYADLKKDTNTYSKIATLKSLLPEVIKKVKTTPVTDEDTKKKLKTAEDTVQELMSKIEKMNSEYTEKEKHWQKTAEEKISEFQLVGELEKLANSYKFGKAYDDPTVRKDITKVKLDALRALNHLKLITKEDGTPDIQVLDKDGKPRFNGNSAITINQLLEDSFKKFIKVSNAGDENDNPEPQTNRFEVPDGKQKTRQGARTTVQ